MEEAPETGFPLFYSVRRQYAHFAAGYRGKRLYAAYMDNYSYMQDILCELCCDFSDSLHFQGQFFTKQATNANFYAKRP